MTVPHETRAHSELGASICSRWWNCPGSVRLSRGLPNPSTPHSRRGTAAHEMAEFIMKDGVHVAPAYVGNVVTVDGEDITFTEDMAEDVQVYIDTCDGVLEQYPGAEHWLEVQFDLSPLKPPAPMFGTCDFGAYIPAEQLAILVDYKNGYLHVSEKTPQLKYYVLGLALWLGKARPVRKIRVGIVQPNGQGEPVRWQDYDVVELAQWAGELLERARATQAPDAPLHAGPWCKFCPVAKAGCPERSEKALEVAGIEFAEFLVSPQDTRPRELRTLAPGELSHVLDGLDMLEQWIKDARALANTLLEQDANAVPHYKRVAKRPVRSVADEDGFVSTMETYGESPYAAPELLSPAKAEAALEPYMPGKTKKARLEAAKAVLAGVVQSVSSGATLAHESDPRPALPASGAEFDNLLQ